MIKEMVEKENARVTHEWDKFKGDEIAAIALAEKQGTRFAQKVDQLGYKTNGLYFEPDEQKITNMLRDKYKHLG